VPALAGMQAIPVAGHSYLYLALWIVWPLAAVLLGCWAVARWRARRRGEAA
jgi:hypothetical protein